GRLKQHDGVGVVVHLEQLEAEKLRVKAFLLEQRHRPFNIGAHRLSRQGISAQKQQKQKYQGNDRRQDRPPRKLQCSMARPVENGHTGPSFFPSWKTSRRPGPKNKEGRRVSAALLL